MSLKYTSLPLSVPGQDFQLFDDYLGCRCLYWFQSGTGLNPAQWGFLKEVEPTSSRDGASKRNQHDPNDRLRDTSKFTYKEFHSLFSSERAAEVFDA